MSASSFAPLEIVTRYKSEIGGITELMEPSLHIFAHLLERQKELGVRGDLLEIGVFRAGTASLLASALSPKERLFLIDPYQDANQNRQTIERFSKVRPEQLQFIVHDSIAVNKWRERLLSPSVPMLRFAHIDGEHSYDAVYSDLDLARRFLSSGGMIVVDDVFNMNSACCTHALFDYARDQPFLQIVAMGFLKAYVCENRFAPGYRKFFLGLPELLQKSAGIHARLCFNSWVNERSYLTFDFCGPDEGHYQIIGKRFNHLNDALAALELLP